MLEKEKGRAIEISVGAGYVWRVLPQYSPFEMPL
jgi:hypothetical protein